MLNDISVLLVMLAACITSFFVGRTLGIKEALDTLDEALTHAIEVKVVEHIVEDNDAETD